MDVSWRSHKFLGRYYPVLVVSHKLVSACCSYRRPQFSVALHLSPYGRVQDIRVTNQPCKWPRASKSTAERAILINKSTRPNLIIWATTAHGVISCTTSIRMGRTAHRSRRISPSSKAPDHSNRRIVRHRPVKATIMEFNKHKAGSDDLGPSNLQNYPTRGHHTHRC